MSSQTLLLKLVRRHPGRIALNLLLGFASALFNGIGTALVVPVILGLVGQPTILETAPPLLRYLLLPFRGLAPQQQLFAIALLVLALILLKNLTQYATALAASTLSRAITADLQESGLKLLLEVDLPYFHHAKPGDLVNRMGAEMNRAATSISAAIQLGIGSVTVLVFTGLLLAISWQLTLAIALLFPLSAGLNQWLVNRSKRFGDRITQVSQHYSAGLTELLTGIRLVKSTASEAQEYERFQRLIRAREATDFQARLNSAAIAPLQESINIVSLFGLVLLGRFWFGSQLADRSATLLTYLVVLFRLMPNLAQLTAQRDLLAQSTAAVDLVDDLLRRDNKPFMQSGVLPYRPLQQGIQFREVGFRYAGSEAAVLEGINLTIPRGTTLALAGASGAGKSTLVDLLLRFQDPNHGSITLDGQDLRGFDLRSLRRAIGVVSQETFLFHASVRDNLTYGCPPLTDAELWAAIRQADAEGFILELPQGLDTVIGERGVLLSGGQRQRIAIARALLSQPDILILDEATSALDAVSESLVQRTLDQLSRDRTTLVVAHRLSTIRNAHQIAVLDRGRVAELGTHEELLHKGGIYRRLYATQLTQTVQQIAALSQQEQLLSQTSYSFRTRLHALLGSLDLLLEGLVDTPDERNELVVEAYQSAVGLYSTLKQLESDIHAHALSASSRSSSPSS